MRLGIVIYSNDSETVWNGFRIATHAKDLGDDVTVFLLGKGVECEKIDDKDFKINEYLVNFVAKGGRVFACSTCLTIRNLHVSDKIHTGTLAHLYEIIRASDRLITF
jgi:uncharacterized protein involved in oxidation of intracellular sulfur